jgi:hypothetical protein
VCRDAEQMADPQENPLFSDSDSEAEDGPARTREGEKASSPPSSPDVTSKKRKLEDSGSPTNTDKEKPSSTFDAKKAFADEAEESSDAESENKSEQAAEEEGGDNYIYDEFVVRDDEASSDDEDLFEKSKLRKKRAKVELKRITKKKAARLDEEDYQLIRDNMYGIDGPPKKRSPNKAADADEGIEPEEGEGEEDDDVDADAGDTAPVAAGRSLKQAAMYDDYDDDSDMEGFIEDEFADEEEEMDETGAPRPRPVVPRQARRARTRTGPTMDQLKDATDIFGDGYDDFDDEKLDDYMEDEFEDEDLTEEERLKKSKDKIRQQLTLSAVVENFCADQDDVIRQTDIPERMQFYNKMFSSHNEMQEEATWMGPKLYEWMIANDSALSVSLDRGTIPELIASCRMVLQFYFVDQFEVPFIVTYRSDYLHPSITSKQVWKMLEFDVLYGRLTENKNRLRRIITAVGDAARTTKDSRVDWVRESRHSLDRISETKLAIRRLQREKEAAEEDHEAALNVVDQRDDEATMQERALVEMTAGQVIKLQALLEEQTSLLQQLEATFDSERTRYSLSGRYRPEAAAEVYRLFPTIRYESMINTARDEAELKDVSDFLHLLLRGSDVAKTPAASKKEKTAESAKQKTAQQQDQQTAQAAVVDSLFGADNDEEDESERAVESQNSGDDDEENMPKKQLDLAGLEKDHSDAAEPLNALDEMLNNVAVQTSAATRHKIASGKDAYVKYKQITQLRDFVEKISVPASDFGDSLRNGFKSEPPPTPVERPEELASQYVDGRRLISATSVLHAVAQIIASEISFEPSVKQFCRSQYRERATISTRPTATGLLAINPFHELFGFHYLDEKPVQQFLSGSASDKVLFLKLWEAERNGLITIMVNPPLRWADKGDGTRATDLSPFFPLSDQFKPSKKVSDELDPVCRELWDKFRGQIIHKAVTKHILPSLQEELRRELLKASKDAVLEQIRDKFADMLSMGPFVPARLRENTREYTKKVLSSCPNHAYVMSVAAIFQEAGNNQASVSMAFTDKEGILRQHSVLPGKAGMDKLKEKLTVFLFDNRPDAIILNASGGRTSRSTKQLLEKTILPEVASMFARARDERMIHDDDDDDDDDYSKPYSPHVSFLSSILGPFHSCCKLN